jgi:hypothetical protein
MQKKAFRKLQHLSFDNYYQSYIDDTIYKGTVPATKLQKTYELQTLLYQKYQTFAAQGSLKKQSKLCS